MMPDLTKQEPFIPLLLKAFLIHEDRYPLASSHSR